MLESWTIQKIFSVEFGCGNIKTNFRNPLQTLKNIRGDGAYTQEYRPTLGIHFYGYSKSCPCGCDRFRVGKYYLKKENLN